MKNPRRPPNYWWVAALFASLLFLAFDSAMKLRTFTAISAWGEKDRPPPPLDARSPTGYASGQRNQMLEPGDSYHWVMQTQRMFAGDGLRIRTVDYDNAPFGREVHWSSPLRWWLGVVAWTRSKSTGESLPIAIERAALYANTLLLGLFLLVAVPVTAWRFGAWPAALLATGLVTVSRFAGEYGIGNCDHHGIVASCALLTVLFLLAGGAGWTRAERVRLRSPSWHPDATSARRWTAASAVAGAAGMWISAATEVPVLVGVGLGALLSTGWLARQPVPGLDARPAPEIWRWWGTVGGIASLLFYLVEYFPSHLGWRLEVNHPLYALAWVGAGDLLCRASRRIQGDRFATTLGDWLLAFLGVIGVLAPAIVVCAYPQRTFAVADQFLWDLHSGYIEEFSSVSAILRRSSLTDAAAFLLVDVNPLHLLCVPALVLVLSKKSPLPVRALVALSLPAALIASGLALQQTRWLSLSCALWLAVLVAITHAFFSRNFDFRWTQARRVSATIFLALIFLPHPIAAAPGLVRALRLRIEAPLSSLQEFVVRDFAYWLRRRLGNDPAIVMSGPSTTTGLIYYGGFKGVGTLYWENRDGLRSTVDVFGASTAVETLEALRRRGVTHLVIFPWDPFARIATRLKRGPASADGSRSFLLDVLERGRELPAWVRPLAFRSPILEHLRDQWVLALEIAPNQSPEEAAVRRAQILAANADTDAANAILNGVLKRNAGNLPALVALAQLQVRSDQREAFRTTMGRIRAALPIEEPLDFADRLGLVQVLNASGEQHLARLQLLHFWTAADERALRYLNNDDLSALVALSTTLNVKAIRPHQTALIESLLADEQLPVRNPHR